MRTLSEIIDAAKDGSPTTHEECLYALLAYSALHYFAHSALMKLANEPSRFRTADGEWREEWRRFKAALEKAPKDFVGWNNDPANPEYRQRLQVGRRLVNRLLEKENAKP